MTFAGVFLILFFLIGCVVGGYFIYVYCRYSSFVENHSISLKRLSVLNSKYHFWDISMIKMTHSYDNEHFFGDVSTKSFLIYQLDRRQQEIKQLLIKSSYNDRLYKEYIKEVNGACELGVWNCEVVLPNTERLKNMEKYRFESMLKRPTTTLSITVFLKLTRMNGSYRSSKQTVFSNVEIEDILQRLEKKRGAYYEDDAIWKAICCVERSMVSNKMRFEIYERDNNRCKICGKSDGNLEIDHIYPISKGGKSTYSNLQTLCHECNSKKSNYISNKYIANRRPEGVNFCPSCGSKLVLKNGRYGPFCGCSRYPACRFVRKL